MRYKLLRQVLDLIDKFQKHTNSSDLASFITWANEQVNPPSPPQVNRHDTLLIGFQIAHLYKDLKKQTKEILSPSELYSLDEYSFLLHLEHQSSFRKMELVQLHNLEAPTGIEIIKRLLKNGLVEEFPDQDDRRAKRIKITSAGAAELHKVKQPLETVFWKFTDGLEASERSQLSNILQKLIGKS